MKIKHSKKIVVAMSGGVDSSVAATLLKKQGYDCIGIFLKFWKDPKCLIARDNTCCDQESLIAARQVASKLEMPFYVLDVSQKFKKDVVDYYIREYENGRTPNPCVVCNKKIKFGWLLEKAKELGAKYLATGHYARISLAGRLLKAKDTSKDQTYFLWQLTKDELERIRFPLGNYSKSEVRKMAHDFGLSIAEKKDSQDICFIEKGKNNDFLTHYAKKLIEPGQILDVKGNILGTHDGLMFYTLGQRHGLKEIQIKDKTGGFEPAYVVKLKPDRNQLIVGGKKDLYKNTLNAKNINLLGKWPKVFSCQAKIRYQSELVQVEVTQQSNKLVSVVLGKPQRAITPGQSIVFYKGSEVIGGGIIK